MNNDPIQLKMKVLVFDNIVFVMAPKINPAPAILTKSHIHYLLTIKLLSQMTIQANHLRQLTPSSLGIRSTRKQYTKIFTKI